MVLKDNKLSSRDLGTGDRESSSISSKYDKNCEAWIWSCKEAGTAVVMVGMKVGNPSEILRTAQTPQLGPSGNITLQRH
jgi:hypothetical protein